MQLGYSVGEWNIWRKKRNARARKIRLFEIFFGYGGCDNIMDSSIFLVHWPENGALFEIVTILKDRKNCNYEDFDL